MAQTEQHSLESFERNVSPMSPSNNYSSQRLNDSNERSVVLPSSSSGQSDIQRDRGLRRPGNQSPLVLSSTPSDPSTDSEGSERERAARATVKEYGINVDPPKHGNFAILRTRLDSFRHWSPSIRQRPRELAEAGFYYAGHGDMVVCFYCGQGLHSWEPEDDVWEEHCKWAPKCPFLLNVKGQDFIKMMELKSTDPIAYNNMKQKLEEKERKNNAKYTPRTVQDGEVSMGNMFARINDLLARPSAAGVAEFYSREKTKQAIQIFIKQNGNNNFNAEKLMNIILDMEEGIVKYDELFPSEEDGARGSDQPVGKDQETEMLKAENAQLRRKALCTVCHNEIVSIVFLPCGHLCSCADCAPSLRDCKACGTFIKGTVRTFLTKTN